MYTLYKHTFDLCSESLPVNENGAGSKVRIDICNEHDETDVWSYIE